MVDEFPGYGVPRKKRHRKTTLSSIEIEPASYGSGSPSPSHLSPPPLTTRTRRPTMPDPQPVDDDVIASLFAHPAGRQHRSMSHDISMLYPTTRRHGHHDRHEHWWNRHSSGLENDFLFFEPWQPCPGDRPMYEGADMPSTDLPEDHKGPEPQMAPPDISRLTKVTGYEGLDHHSLEAAPPIPPPSYEEATQDPKQRPEEKYSSVHYIDTEHARNALINYVSEKCCFGKRAANNMDIVKVSPSSALHYTLETYTESRVTIWVQEPYRGQFIDGPDNGAAPGPWDIHCNPNQTFHDEIHHLEVPHTASILACHACGSMGWTRCHSCYGRGYKRCNFCHGSGRDWKTDAHGHRHTESCWHCHGSGRKRCMGCGGDGRTTCLTCTGYRQLKLYIRLTVTYKNNLAEHIVERTDMPDQLVKDVHGELVYEQTQPRVWPISNYPDKDVCNASRQLTTDQVARFQQTSRILLQRQRLKAVPVTECAFNWRGKDGRFWVYGNENAVYAPDYPQKYCWGCAIL